MVTIKMICLIVFVFFTTVLFGQTKKNEHPDFETLPVLQWRFKSHHPFLATATVSENTVYVGGLDSTLYALNINTGEVKWRFKTGGEIRSTVCLDGSGLFLYSGDASLYSLDNTTGKVLWTFKTKGGILGDRRYDFADYFQSSPVVHQGRVFLGAGDERVYALNSADGKLLWSFKASGILHTTPVIYKDRLFIGSFDGNLYALSQDHGELLWKFKTLGHRYFPDGEVQGSPVVANDLVYVGARDYNVYAIDAMGGYVHWNKTFPFGWALALTPRDSVMYVGTSDDRVLVSLDGATGKELWRTQVKFNIFGTCSYSKNMAYVGTLMGKLFGIDLRDGKIKWTYATDSYKKNHLKYFKEDDAFRDDIMKLIKTPADFIAMEYALGAIFSTPVIAHDRMIVTSTDGTIYCFKK